MIIMSKLVQKISWNLNSSGFQKELQTEMYMYGEASFRVNKAMQEPLEKLYQYENQPTIEEFIFKFKDEYYHKVGTQFDNAILEMEKAAKRLKH